MQDEHRRAIRKIFGSLVEQTDLDLVVSSLYEKGVFSEAMIEPYKDLNKDTRTRKRQLYRDIERRGPNAFPCLLEALTETGHWSLVRDLDPNSDLHARSARPGPSTQTSDFVSLKNKNKNKELEAEHRPQNRLPFDNLPPENEIVETPKFEVIKSKKFYEESKNGISLYKTRSKHRGVLIAFIFSEFTNDDYRKGANVDSDNLKYLFNEMGFKTLMYKNLLKSEMVKTLDSSKTIPGMKETECVFIVVSSHGYEKSDSSDTDIRCSDGLLISMLSIVNRFNNDNCPVLKNVPKIFVFQTCRGSSEYETKLSPPPHLQLPRGSIDGSTRTNNNQHSKQRSLPLRMDDSKDRLFSDILIANSTLPGFVSRRDPETGSWYIQTLCEVFATRAHECHVDELFALVDKQLSEKFGYQTSSIDKWGFNSLLYLHPGLFEN